MFNLNNFKSSLLSQKDMDEKITYLRLVSGYSVDELIEMFLKGYTLQSPEYASVEDLRKFLERG